MGIDMQLTEGMAGPAAGPFSPPAKKVSRGDDEGRAVGATVWEV
jgi:hypothetical protein